MPAFRIAFTYCIINHILVQSTVLTETRTLVQLLSKSLNLILELL